MRAFDELPPRACPMHCLPLPRALCLPPRARLIHCTSPLLLADMPLWSLPFFFFPSNQQTQLKLPQQPKLTQTHTPTRMYSLTMSCTHTPRTSVFCVVIAAWVRCKTHNWQQATGINENENAFAEAGAPKQNEPKKKRKMPCSIRSAKVSAHHQTKLIEDHKKEKPQTEKREKRDKKENKNNNGALAHALTSLVQP